MSIWRSETGFFVERCPECQRENYSMAVASGICAWCGWEPKWGTADGRQIRIEELESDHIKNIIKYCFSMNHIPTSLIFMEAKFRVILKDIGEDIKPEEGYKSPEQLSYEYRENDG